MTGKFNKLIALTVLLAAPAFSFAQKKQTPTGKAYFSTGIDGYLLSTTLRQKAGESMTFSTPRFTAFLHLGLNVNYDFNKNIGLFTGINVKNIGFIEKFDAPDSTVKRRVYTFGIPLAVKLGNVKYGKYLMLGGGIDFPFNYKEKGFVKRNDKAKFNEWFSSRTPAAMPYVFIGAHIPLMAVKLQFYPANFMNNSYTTLDANGNKYSPYANYDVQLAMLTLGFDITYKPKE